MVLTFTAGQTGAGVDGCTSGALNCARAELFTVSAYECSGGRAEGTPEDPTRGLFLLVLMTKIETMKQFEILRCKHMKGSEKRVISRGEYRCTQLFRTSLRWQHQKFGSAETFTSRLTKLCTVEIRLVQLLTQPH